MLRNLRLWPLMATTLMIFILVVQNVPMVQSVSTIRSASGWGKLVYSSPGYCVYKGKKLALNKSVEVPVAMKCAQCGAKTMLVTCVSPIKFFYCCGPKCKPVTPPVTSPNLTIADHTPQQSLTQPAIDTTAAIGGFISQGVDVSDGQGLTASNPIVLFDTDSAVVGVPSNGFVYVNLPVGVAYSGVAPYNIEIIVNGKVVWTGTQPQFTKMRYFKTLVPSDKTVTYSVRATDSRGQTATSLLYFVARVGQGLPCSPTNVQSNVDASACNGIKAGATCELTCAPGYVSTGNTATYTCDPQNSNMNVAAFSCRKTTCFPENINTGVDASNCNVNGGEQCVLNCDPGYIQSSSSSPPRFQCPVNGGPLDVSGFQCITRPPGVCTAIYVDDYVDASMCSGITAGALCQPQCLPGYTPYGTTSFVCPPNGGDIGISSFTCSKVVCTVTNVGSNVDASNCQNLPSGDSCYAECNSGYISTNNSLFTCPLNGGSIDVSGFACTQILPNVCDAVHERPYVNATSCNYIIAGQTCQISCFNEYVPTGSTGSYTCPAGGGSIDVSNFTCGKVRDCQGEWSSWSACSAECGTGTQTRVYTILEQSQHGGSACPHDEGEEETKSCPGIPCDGGWTEWVDGPCRVLSTAANDSLVNTRSRTRECTNPPPDAGGEDCEGPGEEVFTCCSYSQISATIPNSGMSFGNGYTSYINGYNRFLQNLMPTANIPPARRAVVNIASDPNYACASYCIANLPSARNSLTAIVTLRDTSECLCYDNTFATSGATVTPVNNAIFQPLRTRPVNSDTLPPNSYLCSE